MAMDHSTSPFIAISSIDLATYYKLLGKEEAFNTRWLSNFVIMNKDTLREWWQDPSKFQVISDRIYRRDGLNKAYQLIPTMMNQLYDSNPKKGLDHYTKCQSPAPHKYPSVR